ncbi:MAG: NUDIX hydrolase [Gammaproteobacteria bacterium]|nr:NUDIX hydrolase [Gammaproteobacteria bacterium]
MSQPPQARFSICVIEDDARRLLFLHRAPTLTLEPNKWGFPAGHIEEGEVPRACAYRELAEEIGTGAKVLEKIVLGPLRDSFYGGIYEIHLFHFHWLGGSIELNHEHSEYRWAGPDDYQDLDLMDGIEEDIALLDLWPRSALNQARLPPALRG